MVVMNTKYPRTYHVPWSPGATSDDKKLPEGWFVDDGWADKELVITEKLDGENSCMTNLDVYARPHGAPTRSPWSVNLWGDNGLYWHVRDLIAEGEYVYGENLYGEHSIHYDRLPTYFFIFAFRSNDYWYDWDSVVEMAKILSIPTVPVLYRSSFHDVEELKAMVDRLMSEPSTFGVEKEGVVIRKASSFLDEDKFAKNVCKYVRANHVQTDEHWTKNWKRATLNPNICVCLE